MKKVIFNTVVITQIILHFACKTVIQEQKKENFVRDAMHHEIVQFSIQAKEWDDLESEQRTWLKGLSFNYCIFNNSKKESNSEYPTYKFFDKNEKFAEFNCLWNFRKELIEIRFQLNRFPDKEFKIYWYTDFPTLIQYYSPDEEVVVTRSWEWSIMKRKWESTKVFIGFEYKKKGHKVDFYFSRFTGSITSRREYRLNDEGNWIMDGWQYNYDDKVEEEQCHEFKLGKLISTDHNQCQIRFPEPIPKPQDIQFDSGLL